ncbi:MAG: PAS domain S-box protein [Limisphaerales bacterium]
MKKTRQPERHSTSERSVKEHKPLVSTRSTPAQRKPAARTRRSVAVNSVLIQQVERRLVEAANSIETIEKQYHEVAAELHASTLEIRRSNDELRKANEFLAASKQNLQSVNVELVALNNEKARRNNELHAAQTALAAAHDDAEDIVRSAHNPVLILDAAMNVEKANEAFYKTFRVSPAEIIGRPVFELGHTQWNIPRLRELLGDVLPRHSFFDNFEVTHHFDGLGERTMLLNGRTLASSNGKPGKVLLEIQDVSQMLHFQAQMRHSERRYRRLFEAARDGVLIVDPNTRKILDANPFMSELLGYVHEALLGKELFEIGLLKDAEASREAFRELQEKGFIRYENLPLKTKTGQLREVEFVSNLYPEGEKKIIQCNIRDVTARKHAEEATRKLHADLLAHTEELSRFNRLAVGRELRMIELKKEVNELHRQHGEKGPYPLEFEQNQPHAPSATHAVGNRKE